MVAFCLIVNSSNALAEVLLLVRWFEAGHHLAEVVEEGAELEKAEVDSTAKRFWKEAVAKEETQSNLKDKCKYKCKDKYKYKDKYKDTPVKAVAKESNLSSWCVVV